MEVLNEVRSAPTNAMELVNPETEDVVVEPNAYTYVLSVE
jgi:hypothetical protein